MIRSLFEVYNFRMRKITTLSIQLAYKYNVCVETIDLIGHIVNKDFLLYILLYIIILAFSKYL